MNARVLSGNCLKVLAEVPDGSVHCVVTSPPYWALRRYEIPDFDWPAVTFRPVAGLPDITILPWAGQLGLEPDLWAYVGHVVAVFREVHRVLRRDGTAWVNLGDCYTASGWGGGVGANGFESRHLLDREPRKLRIAGAGRQVGKRSNFTRERSERQDVPHKGVDGIGRKNALGVPWRVALALQADGWNLRSDVTWWKPNGLPESASDRPGKCHEYVFMLTKEASGYFYDAEAVKEKACGTAHVRTAVNSRKAQRSEALKLAGAPEGSRANKSFCSAVTYPVSMRNKRTVWAINTTSLSEEHYAAFPPELAKIPILASTSEGGVCAKCGAPLLRVLEDCGPDTERQKACGGDELGLYSGKARKDYKSKGVQYPSETKARILAGMRIRKTVGWKAQCSCSAGTVPATVLDPFGGSGTVGMVAAELKRDAILIEAGEAYCQMAKRRCDTVHPALL